MTGATWLDAARAVPVVEVAAALGFDVRRDGRSFGPCPACDVRTRANPGRSDRRGRCSVTRDGGGWHCFSNGTTGCGAKGDGLALVALREVGRPWASGDARATVAVRAWFVGNGLCDDRVPVQAPGLVRVGQVAEPACGRPDATELAQLWFHAERADLDPEVAAYLRSRGLDPVRIADLDLARALPPFRFPADWSEPSPAWARFKGRPWSVTGHRLILPAWEADPARAGRLRLASVLARCVRPCGDRDKAANPAGCDGRGLVLAMGDDPLADGVARQLVTICEGATDFLTWALQPPAVRGALLGSWSGSAQHSTAALVPSGWTVALAHDNDAGGETLANAWRREIQQLGRDVRCARCRP